MAELLYSAADVAAAVRRGEGTLAVIFSDEPCVTELMSDAAAAEFRKKGYEDITRFSAGTFSWEQLTAAAGSFDMFSSKRIFLVSAEDQPVSAAEKALPAVKAGGADTAFIIICKKITKANQTAKWYKSLIAAGAVTASAMAPFRQQLPQWFAGEAKRIGVELSGDALAFMASSFEGNLGAGLQELRKLALERLPQPISLETVRNSVSPDSRYDVFALSDAMLSADMGKAVRIVSALREAGEETMGIIRVIGKDLLCIDALQRLSYRRADTERAFSGMKVWPAKKNMCLNCARRLHTSAVRDMISDIAAADRASCTFAEEEAWSRIMDCMGRLRDTRR
ncbi:MAG: DNA polymerase III subunit delta [Pseudomonadota bacterium]|nr:DNA polymerase III subunit delta [Pseudomonadota bacterium]